MTSIDTVLVSSTLDPKYLDFFPIVHKAWKDIVGINCILVLIANSIPEHLSKYKSNIILYNNKNVSPVFQSQCIRLLIPGIINEYFPHVKGVIISDIDMIPTCKDYYNILLTDKFVVYRNAVEEHKEYPMCYNAATPAIWNDVFGTSDVFGTRKIIVSESKNMYGTRKTVSYENKVDNILESWYLECTEGKQYSGTPGHRHWCFDQRKLYSILQGYKNKVILHSKEDDAKTFKRIDRLYIKSKHDISAQMESDIKTRKYMDFHMIREGDKTANTYIFELLFNKGYSPENKILKDPEYGTHIIPLTTAVLNTTGPIIEFGMGEYSTPLLHMISSTQQRLLISADTSKDWINNYSNMGSKYHHIFYCKVYDDDWEKNTNEAVWDNIPPKGMIEGLGDDLRSTDLSTDSKSTIGKSIIGVVFIDHRPGDRRKKDILRFKDSAEIIVVHDTEQPSYGYEQVLNLFKYRYDFKRYSPYTTLVSNFTDVSLLFLSEPKY